MINADDALQLFSGGAPKAAPAVGAADSLPAAALAQPEAITAPSAATGMLDAKMSPDEALAAMGGSTISATSSKSLGKSQPAQTAGSPSIAGDAIKSGAAGLVSGIENAGMVPAQIGNLAFHYGIVDPLIMGRDVLGYQTSDDMRAKLRGIQPLPNTPEQAGARLAGAGLSAAGYDIKPEDIRQAELQTPTIGDEIHKPETTAGQYANTIGQFVGGGKTMGMGKGVGLPEGTPPAQTMLSKFGQIAQQAPDELKAAAPLIAGGIGSETGGQIFEGTPLETPARIIGGLAGGKAYEAGAKGIELGRNAAGNAVDNMGIGAKEMIVPGENGAPDLMATQAQQRAAGQKLIDASRNPDTLVATLKNEYDSGGGGVYQPPATGVNQGSLQGGPSMEGQKLDPFQKVAGSSPTLAEATLDPGIIQWQDALRSKNRDQFLSRASDQNVARNKAISGVGGIGNPEAVGQFFGDHLKNLDETTQGAVDKATGSLTDKTDMLGGRDTPQQYGSQLRDMLDSGASTSKAKLSALWDVMKPYNETQINGSPIVNTARSVINGVDEAAGQSLTPHESNIFNAVSGWTDHPTFGRLKTLRSEVADAQRQLRMTYGNESQPMRRIGMLKSSIDKSISDAVTGISHVENHAVEAGHLAPENSLESKLAALRDQYYADRKSQVTTGANPPKGPLNDAFGNRPQTVSGVGAAAGDSAGRPRTAAGNQGAPEGISDFVDIARTANNPKDFLNKAKGITGVSPELSDWFKQTYAPKNEAQNIAAAKFIDEVKGGKWDAAPEAEKPSGEASFDAKGQKAYEAARAATVEHKETFRNGIVGKALKEGRAGAQYAVPDSNVAGNFFNSKATSPENIEAFHKAVGGKVEAMNALQDYAASDLRAKAINPDGTINPQAFSRWSKQHQNAINSFPELKKGLSSVKSAQEFLTEKMAERKTQLDEFNKSKASAFINADPVVAIRRAFGTDNSAATFGDLVKRVSGDHAATAGLKRAAADFILQEVRGAEKGDTTALDLRDPKAFRKFVDKNNGALKVLFGGQGLNNLERVVADMRRSSLITKGAKLPSQSNTTQDALAVMKQGEQKSSILSKIVHEVASHAITGGAIMGELAGGHPLVGVGVGIGAKLIGSMKSAGMKTIDQLQLEAALNPKLAHELIKKATAEKIPVPVQNRIGMNLLKLVPIAAAHRVTQDEEK